jgi:uncharacterized membrane-anchored protein YjiN (DUF445 family)
MVEINIFHRKDTDVNIDGSEGVFVFYTVIEFKENGIVIEEKTIESDYIKTFEQHILENDIENVNDLFKQLADWGDDEYILKISEVGHYFVYGKKIEVTNKDILNALSRYTSIYNETTRKLLQLVVEDIYSSIVNVSNDNLLIKEIIKSVLTSVIELDEPTAANIGEAIKEVIENHSSKEATV